MVSKRILLATVCLVVLVIAFGAYAYTLYSEVSSLGGRLDDLQREINLLKYRIGFTNTSKTFNFFWQGPVAEKFNVTTFWMNITFQRENETHLQITVKVNDLNTTYTFGEIEDYVGIVFDWNNDGLFDLGDQYLPDNCSRPALLGKYRDGQRFFDLIAMTMLDNTHETYYDPELGYTYVIPVNLYWRWGQEEYRLANDLIHIEYSRTVSVEFSFGMELIA